MRNPKMWHSLLRNHWHTLLRNYWHSLLRIIQGYCIKFKTLKNLNIDILEEAIRYGIEQTNAHIHGRQEG